MKNLKKEKINILYISSFSSLKGGGQRSLYLLIKHLDKEKFTPFLMVPEKDELFEEVSRLGIKVFVFDFPRVRSFNIFKVLNNLIRLCGILRKENISIIHTDSPRETFYSGLAGKTCGAFVVLHARTSDSFFWLDRMLYSFSDHIIAVSFAVADRFKPFDRKGKVKVVYNGAELDVYKLIDEKHNNKKLALGYFGRIDRRKGIETVVKAVKEINSRDIELIIMGDGDPDYLDELKKASGDGRIIFKGYKQNILDDVFKVDVLILPSLKNEGMPRAIIEAMALGKLIIVSDVTPHLEIMGEELKDYIFPAGEVFKLKSIIEGVLNKKNILFEKKEILRKKAERLFDIKKNTVAIENIYKLMCGIK